MSELFAWITAEMFLSYLAGCMSVTLVWFILEELPKG